jgi:citrate lyase subunit beta/citryl-CoA lyase
MLIPSKLFVPGSTPELFEKAVNSPADAVSFDLEDAVAPDQKEAARGSVISFVRAQAGTIGKVVIVRVNALSTPWFAVSDVRVALEAISRAEDVCGFGQKIRILANIEVRLAAGEAGIRAYDAAFPDMRNPGLCRADAEAARRLGYAGKSCIHPNQITIANEVFAPRGEEIEYAGKVLSAAREPSARGIQAFVIDGQLIDVPMIENARAVAAAAHALEPDAL